MFPKSNLKDWQLWFQIFRKKWYIPALALFLSASIGLFLAFTIDAEYESTSTLMILDTDLLSGSSLRFVPSVPQLQEIDYLRKLITSNDFLMHLFDSLDVKSDPQFIQRVEELSHRYSHMPKSELIFQLYVEELRKQIDTRNSGFNIFEIRARGKTPEKAYELCSLITRMAIDETQKRQLQSVSAATSLGHELLAVYRQRMNEAENQLKAFNRGLTQSAVESSLLNANKYAEIQSLVLSTQIEKKTKEEEIQELKQSTRTASQPFRRELDVNVAELRNKLLARIDNVCMLYRQFTWRDIEVVQLNEEIARLKKEIHETIQKSVEKYSDKIDAPLRMQLIKLEKLQLELAVINHSLNTFNSILEAHNESVKSEPSQQVLRERLLREINNNREIYELLAQQIQGTKIRESAQQKEAKMRYQILEPPKRPLERIKPNRRRILFAALLLGGMLGMGVAVGSETLDLSIKYPEEVEDFLNVPVLATIPKMTPITKSLKMQRA